LQIAVRRHAVRLLLQTSRLHVLLKASDTLLLCFPPSTTTSFPTSQAQPKLWSCMHVGAAAGASPARPGLLSAAQSRH
jgi:hypothetical protein